MSSKKTNPGALAGATGAECKAGELRHNDSRPPADRKAFPAQAAWRERNPLKRWAHVALASGLRRGLVTPLPCEDCGHKQAEAHHPDYHRPLAVRWLCRRCHKRVHARKRRAGR